MGLLFVRTDRFRQLRDAIGGKIELRKALQAVHCLWHDLNSIIGQRELLELV